MVLGILNDFIAGIVLHMGSDAGRRMHYLTSLKQVLYRRVLPGSLYFLLGSMSSGVKD